MNYKWKLGTLFGIGVYLHWTFPVLLGWILFFGGGLVYATFLLTLFACIVAHEYGHVLMARHYGIGTRDITLYPIGGVAALRGMPKRPREEVAVALAGPAVNLAIALVLTPFFLVTGQWIPAMQSVSGFFIAVAIANVILAGFNLIPAFPMDGGRVLRACLTRKHGYLAATDKAAKIGQFFAGIFAFFAILTVKPMFLLLALFVYVMAGAERRQAYLERDSRWFLRSPQAVPLGHPDRPSHPLDVRGPRVIEVEVISSSRSRH